MGDPARGGRKTVFLYRVREGRAGGSFQSTTSLLHFAQQGRKTLCWEDTREAGGLQPQEIMARHCYLQPYKLLSARIAEMLASAHYKGDGWQEKVSRCLFIAGLKVGINGKSPSLGGKLVCWMTNKEVLR